MEVIVMSKAPHDTMNFRIIEVDHLHGTRLKEQFDQFGRGPRDCGAGSAEGIGKDQVAANTAVQAFEYGLQFEPGFNAASYLSGDWSATIRNGEQCVAIYVQLVHLSLAD
ncbi:hypothetical protein NHH88_02945 [Oxalobacteraceae bacterium OTU3CAMAD1]|nr:hypothetical protein NHH88_02945 [Oxalobacteraceae bacterium OTU3CAMAD1]